MSTVLAGRTRPSGTSPSAAEEAEYDRLRGLARSAQDKRKLCFAQSKAAFKSGQRARAKELSNQAKKHDLLAKDYHRQARDYIFRANNTNSKEDEIDLHGLYVEEAKDVLRKRINAEKARGGSGIHVIVGKGKHSDGKIPKIKPAVEELCRELKLQVSPEQNAGRVYISMAPSRKQASQPEVHKPKLHTPPGPAPTRPSPMQQQQQQQQQQRISSGAYVAPSYVTPSNATPGYVTPNYVASSYVAPSYAAPSYVAPSYVAPVRQSTYGTVPQPPRPTPQQHVRPPSYYPPRPPPQDVYPDLESGRVDGPRESVLSRLIRGIFGGISDMAKGLFKCVF